MHREIPALSLPDTAGRNLSTWHYKQQHPLVLVFAADDPAVLGAFAARREAYRSANAAILGIVSSTSAPLSDPPFPILVDREGAATMRYTGGKAEVLVTDAFGVLEGRFEAHDPDHERILALLSALEMRCPECGVAEWPPDDA